MAVMSKYELYSLDWPGLGTSAHPSYRIHLPTVKFLLIIQCTLYLEYNLGDRGSPWYLYMYTTYHTAFLNERFR